MLAWRLIRSARLTRRALDAALTARGATLNDYAVLCALADAGAVSQKDLAGSVDLSEATLARLVERMERAGLLARERLPANRRLVTVVLTEAGRALQAQLAGAVTELDDSIRGALPGEDAPRLHDLLGRLSAGLETAVGTTPPP